MTVVRTSVMTLATLFLITPIVSQRSFQIDHHNDRFLKDGEPFRFVSGSIHYFRVPQASWRDRLTKMKMAGLNAVDVYVEWSGHEPEPGEHFFDDNYDLELFLDIADELGLLVLFRPGPYICAERDNGGLPYWLLSENPNMTYRTADPTFMKEVTKWFGLLLPMMKPYLYENGGPIILVQVENEYGAYFACDKGYMQSLVSLLQRHLGSNVPLFLSNQAVEEQFRCDKVPGVLPTINMNALASVNGVQDILRKVYPGHGGPFVVAEYYSGWMDHWGGRHASVNHTMLVETFEELMEAGASVNFYMFHGGTNFGFTSGSSPPWVTTSYDYYAPLSEAGDPTPLYYMLRKAIAKYLPLPLGKRPVAAPKANIGKVFAMDTVSLKEVMDHFAEKGLLEDDYSQYPQSFEEFGQAFGYVVYTTQIPKVYVPRPMLTISEIKDRGYISTGGELYLANEGQKEFTAPITAKSGDLLTIIVENMGRTNFGKGNHDMKGILSNVTLDGEVLTNWTMAAVPIANKDDIDTITNLARFNTLNDVPRFFVGSFILREEQEPRDTFLDPTGFTKGVAFMNGVNLGRYWPGRGPQVTLYVPGCHLRSHPQRNSVVLLEFEGSDGDYPSVRLVRKSKLDGPV